MKKLLQLLTLTFLTLQLNLGFAQSEQYEGELDKLESLLKTVNLYYVDSLNNHKVVEKAIIAMLEALDPHSVYIPKEDLQRMNEPLNGNFEGIGIQYNILKDTIVVVSPISGGPSEKLGIRAGDKIVKIDDKLVAGIGIKNSDVMAMLRGKKGTKVHVDIQRRGNKNLLDYTIIRDKIPIYSVEAAYMARPEIGYIKISRFASQTHEEFMEKLMELKKSGMKDLVVDLRGNGGGYLETAFKIGDEFLDKDKMIVNTKGLRHREREYKSTDNGEFKKGKLVILMDEGSASASEILAGAIQDWDRGLIVGRKSFGKGLVQKQFYLPDGSAVRLTTARYYTPSGRCIQKPYDNGKNAYYKEITERMNHGELYDQDSIKFPDSLKYQTNAKRTVFGGGGIMPDVFVPLDTSDFTDYYGLLIRKGIFNQFVLTYLEDKRDLMKEKYPDFKSYDASFEASILEEEFKNFATENEVALNNEEFETSQKYIFRQLKALIASNLWSYSEYCQIWNEADDSFLKAVESIEGNAFNRYKLSYK